MTDETPENKPSHAERVQSGRKKKLNLRLPVDSPHDWPKNFGELVEWYTHEVEDLNRAVQMRVAEASAFIDDCATRKISLEQARERWAEYDSRWGDAFTKGVSWTRGKSDEDINREIAENLAHRRAREDKGRG